MLMGYTAQDVREMQDTIVTLKDNIKNNKHPEYQKVMDGIGLTLDLLEGLLEEGHVK